MRSDSISPRKSAAVVIHLFGIGSLLSCFLFFLVVVSTIPSRTMAWSSPGASSIVLLRQTSMLPNSSLWNTFYDAPAGEALFSLSSEGYRIVGDPEVTAVPASTSQLGLTAAVYFAHTRVAIPKFLREPLPLVSNLSNTWEVLVKPQSNALLHCRLPFPVTLEMVHEREREALRLHAASMAETLHQWWLERAGERGIYGDGEKSLTGVSQWYVVCPFQAIYRVNGGTLRDAVLLKEKKKRQGIIEACRANKKTGVMGRGDTSGRSQPEVGNHLRQGKKQPAEKEVKSQLSEQEKDMVEELRKKREAMEEKLVRDFKKEHLRCSASFHRLLADQEDGVFQAAFSRVGEYDEHKSLPAWNPSLRAWEMWYPSSQLCTELSANRTTTTTTPKDYYWRTRVLLKCFRERGSPMTGKYDDVGVEERQHWRVTEVRQRCLIEMELSSDVVCLWDDYLDQLNLNPIPCVEIT